MKRSKFNESQIIKALKENESGRSVDEISRELGTLINFLVIRFSILFHPYRVM